MKTTPREEIVSTPEELIRCCQYLSTCSVLGFDTEFVGESTYHPQLCVVQVATPERLILIDPLAIGPLDAFWKLIIDPERTSVVHAGREEARLCLHWGGSPPGRLFDLQVVAGMVGMSYPLSHAALVQQGLGIKLDKGETLTEWRERPLTKSQIRYAYDDVRYLLPVWEKLHARLEERGRIEWAVEECARIMEVSVAPATEGEKYRKLKGLGSLDRRRLAVARELHRWREEKAAELNRPARTVVRDDLIIELAKRNPKKDRDLQVVRGLAKRLIPEIFERIQAARALPDKELPKSVRREIDPPEVNLMSQVLSAVLTDWCRRNEMAPPLVATAKDVKQLVQARRKGHKLPEDALLASGWRKEHVLPRLEAMLEGRSRLRIGNVRAEMPFAVEEE